MAGIGFELKKLFNSRGLFASFRAYGYAGVVCPGPMLLGIVCFLVLCIFVIKQEAADTAGNFWCV